MRPRLVLAALGLALELSLAACRAGSAPRSTTAAEAGLRVADGVARPGHSLALQQIGKFENPVYVAGAPRLVEK